MKFRRSTILQLVVLAMFAVQIAWFFLGQDEASYNKWNIVVALVTTLFSIALSWYFSSDAAGFERAINYIRSLIDGSKKVGLHSIQSIRSASYENRSFDTALDTMTNGFKFMGIAGTKWIEDAFKKRSRSSDILRNNKDSSRVRMIFLDPESSDLDRFATDKMWHGKAIEDINKTLVFLNEIRGKQRYQFEVKITRSVPPIRLHIFDHSYAFLSEYKANDSGWNTPQLIFTKQSDTEFPFLISLERVFDIFWDSTPSFDLEAWVNARSALSHHTEKKQISVIHGRFQPFHSEHLEYVLRGIQRTKEKCYIAITNPDRKAASEVAESPHRHEPEANPYTFPERVDMVVQSLRFCRTVIKSLVPVGEYHYRLIVASRDSNEKPSEREICLKFIEFDVLKPESWTRVISDPPGNVTFFIRQFGEWEARKAASFKDKGFLVEILDNDCKKRVTGTLVRELIRTGNDWKSYIPAGTIEVIMRKYKQSGRLI